MVRSLVYFVGNLRKPLAVIDAMYSFLQNYHANAHRANHTLADESTAALEVLETGFRNSSEHPRDR